MSDDYALQIRTMLDRHLRPRGVRSAAVLDAMAHVPRHQFVGEAYQDQAYADRALPTRDGQTISQPYIVAHMTQLLDIDGGGKNVLEIGGGSGYQTAVLVEMGAKVVSVELNESLAKTARNRLDELGYGHAVTIHVGDGTLGYADDAPYDRVLVTAGAPHCPPAYKQQLADGGRIVMPIGDREQQHLVVIERHGDEFVERRDIACRFVPLTGEQGW